MKPQYRSRLWTSVALVSLALFLGWLAGQRDGIEVGAEGTIEQLYSSQRSGVVVESEGVVSRVLSDDLEGSRHQRFIVRLPSGHTVLVSHNIDLAPRVDEIGRGDTIAFRGQYEWNDRGGVVHWTHHDPAGDRPGGWIRHRGQSYE